MKLYVIEETKPAGFKALCRYGMECGNIMLFETKRGANNWMDTLDKVRGQKASDDGFPRSKFRIIELREVKNG